MLIDNEVVRSAKEKLGDGAAIIIATELNLEKFDEKNLKSCCPFHHENTPSFIWNKKANNFHCFSCNKTVDIIDVFMLNGLTYVQSVQKLFEIANIKHSFGEHYVQTKRSYYYPIDIIGENKDKVYDYLAKRKISKGTIDYVGIDQDKHGNIVFKYYDLNDVLTMIKIRPSRKVLKGEAKNWCLKDENGKPYDTTPLLYNMNRINVGQPLLICSGEVDCLSAIEAGFHNAVSIPLGDGNTHWVEENWDWLEEFTDIIICADNDDSGRKFQKDIVYRLGSWRCKVVNVPEVYKADDGKETHVKDLNEVLFWFGKEKVLEIILNAHDTPVDSVIDYSDIKEVDLDEIDGLYTGIQEFDSEMMRLFYGTFNILTGINGSGKSSFISQLVCQCIDQGRDAWLYSKELPNYMTKNWINYIWAGNRHIRKYVTNKGAAYYKVTNEAKSALDDYYKNHLYIYRDEWKNGLEHIKTSMEDSARKFGCKLFVIDNLTAINLECNDNEKWEKQVDFINYLIDFARRYHVVVILVIHPKKIDTMRRLSKMDVAGMGSLVDLAHRLISLYRVMPNDKKGVKRKNGKGYEKEPIKYDVLLDVLKDRMRGRENLSIGLYYDIPSRRFFTNPDEYEYNYSWDQTQYEDHLEYPIKDDEIEIFGN